jgi:hypothetical protein
LLANSLSAIILGHEYCKSVAKMDPPTVVFIDQSVDLRREKWLP